MLRTNRNITLIIISITLLSVCMGIIFLMENSDNPFGDDLPETIIFPTDWVGTQNYRVSLLLKLAISIFSLFVVYIGGRSKHKRFNDRTLELINSLVAVFSKAALLRAVFCFLLPVSFIKIPYRGGMKPQCVR